MSFLKVYGVEVPVADDNLSAPDASLKSSSDAVDGSVLGSVSADRRAFEFTTNVLAPELGAALRGLLARRGDRWGFDLYNGAVDSYSAKGVAPTTVQGLATRTAAVLDTGTTQSPEPKLGNACVEIGDAVTNLLTQNVRTGTDTSSNTTGFTDISSATIASSTAAAFQGSRSLLVDTTTTVGSGVYAEVTALASDYYAGSVYLRAASGAPSVRVRLRDTTNGVDLDSKTVTLSQTQWTRVEVAGAAGAGPVTLRLIVETPVTTAAHFYADAWQLERSQYASTWVDGTRAQGKLEVYLGEHQQRDDLTVMCWVRRVSNYNGTLVRIGDAPFSYATLRASGDDDSFYAELVTGDGVVSARAPWTIDLGGAGVWHHVALVMRRNPTPGSHGLELYVDGVLASTATPSDGYPALSKPTMYVGTDNAWGDSWNGLIDELVVLPFGLTADMIAALYTRALTAWPDLLVSGDALAGSDVEGQFVGEITSDKFKQARIGGAWTNRARILGVKLTQSAVG